MITSIIAIGNSKGIRIPKPLLNESGLKDKVELKAKKGEIKIVPVLKKVLGKNLLFSEKALSDWNKPSEDIAWESLQKEI